MAVLSLIGFGAFVLASMVAGVRLLALARRTRQPAEGAVGAALLLGGGIGYLLMVLALDVLPRSLAPAALLAANLSQHAGVLFLAIGTAHIFRADDAWGRAVVVAVGLVLGFSYTLRLGDPGRIPAAPAVFWTDTIASGAAYAWSAAEAGRYWNRMRRRLRLGLADPAIARRIGLWAAACAAAVAIYAASAVNRVVASEGIHPAVLAVSSAFGLGAAGCLWRAFFPGRSPAAANARRGAA